MKFLLCLFLLCLMTPVQLAHAADDHMVKGTLGQKAKLPPPTPEQLEEAFQVSDSCRTYSITNTYYDCDCVGLKFLEGRQKEGDKANAYVLRENAQHQCPNTVGMAGMIYSSCINWAPLERGADYETFCSCYGSEFGKVYARNPTDNQLVREAQMTEAMTTCKVNSINEQKQDLQKMVKKLKEDGVYDKFLPGAKMVDPRVMPQ